MTDLNHHSNTAAEACESRQEAVLRELLSRRHEPAAAEGRAEGETTAEFLQECVQQAVRQASQGGADECEAVISCSHGIEVSTRRMKTENVTFNKNRSMAIAVYRGGRSGTAATTDLSADSIAACVQAALQIAQKTDSDPCAGICDRELLCQQEQDFGLLHPLHADPQEGIALAAALEQEALDRQHPSIKDSDGAYFSCGLRTRVLANSHDFCRTQTGSVHSCGLTLIGQSGDKMQRGSGFSISPACSGLSSVQSVAEEALEETLGRLNAVKPKTGKYNIILTKNASRSLWGHLRSAISGSNIYLKSSFLCGRLGEQILPDFITLHEDPHVYGQLGSRSFDSEGAATYAQDWVKDGILQEYLLATYSSRKLGLRNNAHSGGTGCVYVQADAAHTYDLAGLMQQAGEGLVIDQVMGQGVNIVSGNYSRGAAGFYFKNGQRVQAVHEFTIASNLKDLFLHIAAVGSDIDDRFRFKTGSLLIPDVAVSAA